MPLVKIINKNIFCWKNEESLDVLLKAIKEKKLNFDIINIFKSKERTRQFLIGRLLINSVLGDCEIKIGRNNKPYIDLENTNISLSHNNEYTILMVSDTPCGVDIQSPTEKIIKIKHKFLNEKDFCFNSNDTYLLSKVWSCKEAVFKKYGDNKIFLKENIAVTNKINDNTYESITFVNKIRYKTVLKQEKLDGNYLSYTV